MRQAARMGGVLALALLAACGKVGPLEPKPSQAPPAKVPGQEKTPTAGELMTPSVQARPGRSDELMRRSERRSNDPFDLPPGSDEEKAQEPAPPADETETAKPT
jgi:predicted small lipoprotein YifL